MGKDKQGRFHPRKGKPTAEGGKKGMVTVDHTHQQEQIELEEKLGIDPDKEILPGPATRHPNRNSEKGHDHTASVVKKSNKHTKTEFKEELTDKVVITTNSDAFTKDNFESLAKHHAAVCISIYLPLSNESPELPSRVDALILKNTLQDITNQLEERGLNQTAIAKIMEPAYEFLRMELFGNAQGGYAVFISENFFKWIPLPFAAKEYVLINSSFYVSPLVQLLAPRERFYVLVISKKQARLFEGDQFNMHYIEISDLPDGIADVVHAENKDDDIQFRSGTGDGSSHHDVVSGAPDEKENIAIYLREVDNTLWKARLAREHVPLILAGVDYMVSLYRGVSQYKHIWKESISGNHDHDGVRNLYAEAKKVIQPHFDGITRQALLEFGNHLAAGRTSIALSEIVSSAWFARVSQLFVANNEEVWGTFDPANNQTEVHLQRHPDDDNLIDLCVSRTLLNGGAVHFIDKDEMPEKSKIAAVLRF